MKNQNEIFKKFSDVFSTPRLDAYLKRIECKDKLGALAAYCWNVKLSEAFYPALQTLEIALRNALNRAISEAYKTDHWFEYAILHVKEQRAIDHAKATLLRQKKPIEAHRIIAELHFGFWTSLFDVRYEHKQVLWPKLLAPVFPYIPKKFRTRHHLSKQLNRIRNLRNRIFHYGPIWYWYDLLEQYQIINDFLQWLSPIAVEHLKMLEDFEEVSRQGVKYYRLLLENNWHYMEEIEPVDFRFHR